MKTKHVAGLLLFGATGIFAISPVVKRSKAFRSPSAAYEAERAGLPGLTDGLNNLDTNARQRNATSLPRFQQTARALALPRSEMAISKDTSAEGGSHYRHFEEEPRDPVWAPQMESILADRMKQAFGKNPSKVGKIQCKKSLCKISMKYNPDGTNDLNAFVNGAPWASVYQTTRSHSDPGELAALVVFDENSRDPEDYAEWVAKRREQLAKLEAAQREAGHGN